MLAYVHRQPSTGEAILRGTESPSNCRCSFVVWQSNCHSKLGYVLRYAPLHPHWSHVERGHVTKSGGWDCQLLWKDVFLIKCTTCAKVSQDQKEPLMSSSFPSLLGNGLVLVSSTFRGKPNFLSSTSIFVGWLEVKRLRYHVSENDISIPKELFATHGIADIVVSLFFLSSIP